MSSTNLSRRKLMQLLSTTFLGTTLLKFNASAGRPFEFESENPKPVFIPPGGGEKGKIGESDITFKLDRSQTSGNLGSSEITIYPGDLGAPPHYHKGFDEICIVREGTVHIMVGEEVFEVPAGGWHLRPRGIVHTFWNSGTVPAKLIELYSPAGHEAYMKALANLFVNNARPKREDLDKLAEKYDIVFVFDKLQDVMTKYKVHL